jgi:hypothetical protein
VLPDELRGSGLALLVTGSSLARLCASVLFGGLWAAFGLHGAVVGFVCALVAALAGAGVVLARTPEPDAA